MSIIMEQAMTEHVLGFMKEMAEAYRALEQEQSLLDRIAMLERQAVEDGERVARLETKLMERNDSIYDLQAKLRSVEAERDDAGFRLLESEDRLDAIRKAIGVPEAIANAVAKAEGAIREELTPKPAPQAEPTLVIVPEAEPHPFGEHGGGLSQPVTASPDSSAVSGVAQETVSPVTVPDYPQAGPKPSPAFGFPHEEVAEQAQPSPSVESGQASEPHGASTGDVDSQASVSTGDGQASAGESVVDPTTSSSDSTVSGGDSGSSEPEAPKPYAGKRYIEVEGFISRVDWLAGGGTDESYDWRPDYLASQAAS